MSENTGIKVDVQGDVVYVDCLDEKLDVEEAIMRWSGELHTLTDTLEGKTLILDFSKVYIATSLVLRELISLKFKTMEMNIPFGLCGLNEYIWETFLMTCLDRAFVIGKDRAEVLALLRPAE